MKDKLESILRAALEPFGCIAELRVEIARRGPLVVISVSADDHCLIHRSLPASGQTAETLFSSIVDFDGERLEWLAEHFGAQVYSRNGNMSSALSRRDLRI